MGAGQDELNAAVYHSPGVEQWYQDDTLSREEAVVLLKHRNAVVGRDVLDIGVGTGRTAIYLEPLAARYEAVDYSPVMVAHVRATMPDVSVNQADMRDLSRFDDRTFDVVLASCNVIDAVSHDDRAVALDEMTRVLRPGGLLLMSSHNLHHLPARQGPQWQFQRHPVRLARETRVWWRRRANHARVGPLREIHAEHALLNDEGHDYGCLHYYISPAAQRRALSERGYEVLDVVDRWGGAVTGDRTAAESPFLFYVARLEDPRS
jgi:SAM-dependent methyltransferase